MEVVKITNPGAAPNSERRRRRVLLQLFIIVAVLLTTVWLIFGPRMAALQKQMRAPELLGELQLIGSYERFDTPAQISKLLGNDIETVSAYTAVYLGRNKRVIVWVGTAEGRDAAAEFIRRMTEGIEEEDSGFNSLQRLSFAGREVFRVDGPSGEHFFYDSHNQPERIIWVTIEATDTLIILEQVVNSF